MKHLWAPWRMEYILSKKEERCIFCLPRDADCQQNLILYQGDSSLVLMNKYPYTTGHLLVAPQRHIGNFEDLEAKELHQLFLILQGSVTLLKKALRPEGFNLGMNLGKIAGAGVADHFHFHIVPRWTGDTNFMPILSDTRVIPEYLEKTYQRLLQFFKDLKI